MAEAQLVEVDGKFAIRDSWTDDFGCQRTATRITPWRVTSGTVISRDDLPMPAFYDQQQWFVWVQGPHGKRRTLIDEVPERGSVESVVLADADVQPSVIARRLKRAEDALESNGRRLVGVSWSGQRKPSKKAISMFVRWVEHVQAGGDPDDQALWDRFYEEASGAGHSVAEDVYETVFRQKFRREVLDVQAGDVVALFSKSTQVPDVIVGELPDIDWCST